MKKIKPKKNPANISIKTRIYKGSSKKKEMEIDLS